MTIDNLVDFAKPIYVIDWKTKICIFSMVPLQALALMAETTRWETDHTTPDVRVLSEKDRYAANFKLDVCIPKDNPILFTQGEHELLFTQKEAPRLQF